jgi:hypothetical protein
MGDRYMTSRSHFTESYAAIVPSMYENAEADTAATPQSEPTPPSEIAGRNDLRVGIRVSFTDQVLQQ